MTTKCSRLLRESQYFLFLPLINVVVVGGEAEEESDELDLDTINLKVILVVPDRLDSNIKVYLM